MIWVFCSLLFLCNFCRLSTSAGWVATTLNYIYPLAALCVTFIPVKLIETYQKTNRLYYVLFFPFVLFAANQEIYAVAILLFSFSFGTRCLLRGKYEYYYFCMFSIAVISLIFILACPGNTHRFAAEIKTWYPAYGELPLIQKSALGVMTLFNRLAVSNKSLFMISSLFIALTVFYDQTKYLVYGIVSLIPISVSLAFGIFGSKTILKTLPFLDKAFVDGRFAGLPQGEQYHTANQMILLVCIAIVLLSYLVSLYVVFKNSKKSIIYLSVIMIGCSSQLVMGFSPTVYASGIRTATLLFMTIAITGTALFAKWSEHRKINQPRCLAVTLIIVVWGFVSICKQIIWVHSH